MIIKENDKKQLEEKVEAPLVMQKETDVEEIQVKKEEQENDYIAACGESKNGDAKDSDAKCIK